MTMTRFPIPPAPSPHLRGQAGRRRRNSLTACRRARPAVAASLLLSAAAFVSAELADVTVQDGRATTSRHVITLADTGLPAQIDIRPAVRELPLEDRAKPDAAAAGVLARIGRGPQLRSAIRLEAVVDGETVPLKAVRAAQPGAKDGRCVAAARLEGGGVAAEVDAVYLRTGALIATVRYDIGKTGATELALIVQPSGPVDLVLPGSPGSPGKKPWTSAELNLPEGEGLVWGNADADAGGLRAAPGLVERCFVGSGDRGWTWLARPGGGWNIDEDVSMMTLDRDAAGDVTWRIRLANRLTGAGERTVRFALLTHPAGRRPAGWRRAAWLEAPDGDAGAPGVSIDALLSGKAGEKWVRADLAGALDGLAVGAMLTGSAGGAAVSAERNLAETFPIRLFRYFAGTHTSTPARLVTNAAELTRPGRNPSPDRMAMGRALLHDAGLDAKRLADRALAVRMLGALEEFGLFDESAEIEFIPYWRGKSVVRFGPEFNAESDFELARTDPFARVHVSVFRKPAGRRGRAEALLVVVNETPQPQREQLYVLAPKRVFGGANRLKEREVVGAYDFSFAPPRSDWGREPMVGRRSSGRPGIVLADAEDHGYCGLRAASDGIEVYGLLYVPAHGVRLMYGSGGK